MHHPGSDIGSLGPCWDNEEQTVSVQVPLTTGAVVSHNSGTPASKGNPASYVQADGSNNMSSVLTG